MQRTRSYIDRPWIFLALLCMSLLCTGLARATTSVLVAPVDPKLYDADRSVALWLENRDVKPVSLQIRVLGWVQRDGREGYEEQSGIVASPPVATIAPGKKQMVRLIKVQPVPTGIEQAYRVLIDEIPVASDAADDAASNSLGIKFQMRYSVPLFVYGKGLWIRDPVLKDGAGAPGVPHLDGRVVDEGGRRFVVVRNTGAVHARLAGVQLVDGENRGVMLADGLLGYVLPGADMRWPLPEKMSAGAFRMDMKVNDEAQPWTVSVSR